MGGDFPKFGRFAIAVFLAVFFTISAPVNAVADDERYLVEYRAYLQAYQSGDHEAALRHGREAWLVAEQVLGDDKLTAILAYNYGKEVIFDEAVLALEAFVRAQHLQTAGIANLPQIELTLYFAYADYVASNRRQRKADTLRTALQAHDASGPEPNVDWPAMWLDLASNDLKSERYSKAKLSAAQAEASINTNAPSDYRSKAQAIIFGGVARLVPFPRKVRDVADAHNEFIRAKNQFPPQADLDSFDTILAIVVAWDAAANAALYSLGKKNYPDQKQSDKITLIEAQLFADTHKSNEECGIEWDRKPPKYPSKALTQGYLGAVIVGYEIEDDGTVKNPRIMAEVPLDTFSKIVLKSMEQWRLQAPLNIDAACKINRLAQFTFSIK